MANFIILNGPNLNLIGRRQPEIYGTVSFDEFIPKLKSKYIEHDITYHQSNHEGVLIDYLHMYGFDGDGIVLNAGAYSHTSIALSDAIKSITTPVIEVHISDITKREHYRHHSYLKEVCHNSIIGQGLYGYEQAIEQLIKINSGLKL